MSCPGAHRRRCHGVWCLVFVDDVVLIDEIREEVSAKLEHGEMV